MKRGKYTLGDYKTILESFRSSKGEFQLLPILSYFSILLTVEIKQMLYSQVKVIGFGSYRIPWKLQVICDYNCQQLSISKQIRDHILRYAGQGRGPPSDVSTLIC